MKGCAPAVFRVVSMAMVSCMPSGNADAQTALVAVRIPPSTLSDGIARFIAQTRQQVLYAPALLKGRRTAGLNGRYTPDQALTSLLKGAGVRFRRTSAGAYILFAEAAPAAPPVRDRSLPGQAVVSPITLDDIVVTGSRLAVNGFNTPTPVTVMDADQLRNRSQDNVAVALNELPQMRGSTVAGAVPSTSADLGTNGQNLLSMRGLGSRRTLVLLDGNRLPKTNIQGSTDLNILPQALIKRVDVVTGGASASYGSEAVAGVVNFILDTRFEGIKGSVNGGVTTYGDNASLHLSLAAGHSFAGGRARIVASAEYLHEDPVGYSNQPNGRDWFDHASGTYVNPVPGAPPRLLVVPDIRHSDASVGGLITSGPLKGMQFGAGGTLVPFDGGTTPTGQDTSGGEGGRVTAQLTPRSSRRTFFAHGEYDLTDTLTAFTELSYGRSRSYNVTFPAYQYLASGQFTVFRGNAYLPAEVAAMFDANPALSSFTVGRFSEDMPPLVNIADMLHGRVSIGIKGRIGGRWSYDTNAMVSKVRQDLDRLSTISHNLYAAADAVRDATGQIVCRSNLRGLDPSCVPMNIFGPGAVSAAAGDYVTGVNQGHTTFRQATFNANMRGDLGDRFALPAGPVAIALGFSYRNESVRRVVDALSATFVDCTTVRGCPAAMDSGTYYGGYLSYNPSPISGRVTASEVYAEMGMPLLKDVRFARELTLTLAGRRTDYNLSGSTYSWKVGSGWQVDDDLRLRYTRSRDIRAPSPVELFGVGSTSTGQSLLPGSTAVYGGATHIVVNRSYTGIGNPALNPERGLTETYGGVYKPSWAPGLQVALDYYDVAISDAIDTPSNVAIIDGCYKGDAAYCRLMTLNSGQTPITDIAQVTPGAVGFTIRATPANITSLRTSGLDFDLSYSRTVRGGTLTARAMGNYLLTASNSSLATTNARLVGALEQNQTWPQWTGSLSVAYSTDRFDLFVQERLISKGTRNANFVEGVDISSNRVPMIAYTDIGVTARFAQPGGNRVELFFGVKNLFDQPPPGTAISTSTSAPLTNFTLYDVLGRRFTLGLRFRR